MKAFANLIRICLQATACVAIASCGGGGGGEPAHVPSITNLKYSPAAALQVPGGTVAINGTLDFVDDGADISALRMRSDAGADVTVQLPTAAGVKAGTGSATFIVSIDLVGQYNFEIWLVDSQGNASNRLSGTFEVLSPSGVHPPSISNLRYSPATAYQAPGGTVTISGTVDFTDAGADIVSLRMVTSAGADLTVPLPAAAGFRSGTGSGALTVSVDQVGKYGFEVWLVDSRGSASNRLAGTFEVVADDTATSWTTLVAAPRGVLLGVGWDANRYLAVGMYGTIMTSTDLSGWAVQTSGVDHTLRSVASSGSRIVAVGDSVAGEAVVLGSTDGVKWSVQHRAGACVGNSCVEPAMLTGVIWTGTQFIAVGQERVPPSTYALILTSPDGIAWTRQSSRSIEVRQASEESGMTAVAWSGSVYVAVGLGPDWMPAAWMSADGATWTRHTIPGYSGQVLRDVTWGNGRFVAVGYGGNPAVFTSVDGLVWQGNTGTEPLSAMNAVTAAGGRYLAVSNTYRETSTDGQTWTMVPSNAACGNDVLWDGRRYVSVGSVICRSP